MPGWQRGILLPLVALSVTFLICVVTYISSGIISIKGPDPSDIAAEFQQLDQLAGEIPRQFQAEQIEVGILGPDTLVVLLVDSPHDNDPHITQE